MTSLPRRGLAALLALTLGASAATAIACASAGASPGDPIAAPDASVTPLPQSWMRGVVLANYETDPFDTGGEGMLKSLQEAAADGANWVSFVPECTAKSIYSTTFSCSWDTGKTCSATDGLAGHTTSDGCLEQAMTDARTLGLKVALYPHIDPGGSRAIDNRSNYAPTVNVKAHGKPDWAAWWVSYDAVINHYAKLAKTGGASLLYVGSEMNTADVCGICAARWHSLISSVRSEFAGKLSYAADIYPTGGSSKPDYANFPAWSQMDYIGIDAYFPLNPENVSDPSVGALVAAWRTANGGNTADAVASMHQLGAKYGKPVIAAEMGAGDSPYAASDSSSSCPSGKQCGTDPSAQANLYAAFLDEFAPQTWFDGMFVWDFQTDRDISPSSSENTYGQVDPRGLPAEQVLSSWWTATTASTSTTSTTTTANATTTTS